ncbi:MAG: type I DNA topoisomerase [Calditrichaeota bacterium]|nr:type I DNA topoisomerase [Calditrichota bacterium]
MNKAKPKTTKATKTVKKTATTKKSKVTAKSAVKSSPKTKSSDVIPNGIDGLIIVESPTKARTLGKYLSSFKSSGDGTDSPSQDFFVMASGGHIIDLPKKKIGVSAESGFIPDYEILPDKTQVVQKLKKAAKIAKSIYIATDPDREGEAIAWHISNEISSRTKSDIYRVTFNEITRKAVHLALSSPGKVDQQKVDAQQARRVMDRLVGYKVSPLLWKTVARGLSAGRVQSVALRLICEREAEITAFKSEEYWTIDGLFTPDKINPFKARLNKLDKKKAKISDKEYSDKICERLNTASFIISDIKRSRKKRHPAAPYITSTLQQDAGRRFGMTVKRTMSVAQKLYEGLELGPKGSVGLITYMRTDSTRISDEANAELRDWIASGYGVDMVNDTVRSFKNKKGAVQDAHEAIRPTDVKNTPDEVKPFLSPQEFKLYETIWKRFVATQMKPAEIDGTKVVIEDDSKTIEFGATGQVIVFQGFLTVYQDVKDESQGSDQNGASLIPVGLEVGMGLDLSEIFPLQHFTQPPPRYSEARLVKELDELGIGRPSTYASIITTIIDRKYVDRIEKNLHPTELGEVVNKILVDRFPDLFNVDFTAKMEEELDRIEMGANWLDVVKDFYTPFNEALTVAESTYKEIKKKLVIQPVGRACPECGEDLVYRWGRKGRFISCSGFPKCKFAENINQEELVEVDEKCPECGQPMVMRSGRFGKFLGCSNYPKCKGILAITTGHKCPEDDCQGEIKELRSKKGRLFYGCTKYPSCSFTSWDQPVEGNCPECGAGTLFQKKSKKLGDINHCGRCDWSQTPPS